MEPNTAGTFRRKKVGIIGTGLVGSTAAYAMVLRGVGREIVLIDIDPKRAAAEAADLLHAVPFGTAHLVTAGTYQDLAGAQVVVITAGSAQKPGETRLDLLERNAAVINDIVKNVLRFAPEAILLVTTNPVDIITHLAAEYAAAFDVPSSRVIGSGTTLDTARFRALLGGYLEVDFRHIHGYVLGEHGDSEVLTWSLVSISGIPLADYCSQCDKKVDAEIRDRIQDEVRKAAYEIIEGKGATYYGIGSALARIVESILEDQRSILTVCTPVKDIFGVEKVTLALPNHLGSTGVIKTLRPPLSAEEERLLADSAQVIKNELESFHEGQSP